MFDAGLIARFVVSAAILVALARLAGWLAERVRQPRVIGEACAGLLVGPAVLGSVAPAVRQGVLPPAVTPLIEIAASLGLAVYLVSVGMTAVRRGAGGDAAGAPHALALVSLLNFAVPFLAGVAVAVPIRGAVGVTAPGPAFELVLGVAFATSAVPVLARILDERPAYRDLGRLALAATATADIVAWAVLGMATALGRGTGPGLVLWPLALAGTGTTALLAGFAGRGPSRSSGAPHAGPGNERSRLDRRLSSIVFAVVGVVVLIGEPSGGSGIGIVFGSLLLGMAAASFLSAAGEWARLLRIVSAPLLSLYFVETGARADIRLLSNPDLVGLAVVVVVVSVATKVGAGVLGSRLSGMGTGDGLALGFMLNTRGLTELVVLNVGLTSGILSVDMFTVFVVMALVTTAMTGPALDLLASRAASRSFDRRAGRRL